MKYTLDELLKDMKEFKRQDFGITDHILRKKMKEKTQAMRTEKDFILKTSYPILSTGLRWVNGPKEVIDEYDLLSKASEDGSIYIEVNKGMYGLPQAGLLANELLEKRLNRHGYRQSKLVPSRQSVCSTT